MRNFLITMALSAAGCQAAAEPTLSPAGTATGPVMAADAAVAAEDGGEPGEDAAGDADTAARRQGEPAEDAGPRLACDCDDGNPCTVDVCQDDGTCETDVPPAGTPCPGGLCVAGACMVPDATGAELGDAGATDAGLSPDNFSENVSGAELGADAAVFVDAAAVDAGGLDAGADSAQDAASDAWAGEDAQAGQPLDAGDFEASGGGSDVFVLDAGDALIDLGPGADAAAEVTPICGCGGDSVALLGDCSVPSGVQAVGAVAKVPGVVGAGYHFAGGVSGPRAVALQVPGVPLAGDFTLQAWVRLAAHVDRSGIASSANFWDGGQSLAVYASFGAAQVPAVFLCSEAYACVAAFGGAPLPLGAWVLVTAQRQQGQVWLTVGGQPGAAVPFAGDLSDALQGLWIGTGGAQGDNHDLPGELDEVRVWSGPSGCP